MTPENGADLAAATTFLLTALGVLILATAAVWGAYRLARHIRARHKENAP